MDAEVRAYRLREVREEQGLTQVELAERMHVTQPTVSQLEGGEIDRAGLSTIKAYVEASAAQSKSSPPLAIASSSSAEYASTGDDWLLTPGANRVT